MIFPKPLHKGTLVRRYKRFLADVVLESGETVTAHCANSGSMLSVDAPGSEVWLSKSDNAARKHAYTWELIRVDGALVGINTQHPNRLAAEAVASGLIAELRGYKRIRREVRMGENSRVDLVLEADQSVPCLVEVKNVTLRREAGRRGYVEFPDAKTVRGGKHLRELAIAAEAGNRAVMFYLAQRPDAETLGLAADIDADYAAAFSAARARGVEAICYRCDVSVTGIEVAEAIPISEMITREEPRADVSGSSLRQVDSET